MIAEENESTGISFSPTGDAYRQAGFQGVFLILPPVVLLLFIVMDSLSGDVRRSPWGLLFAVSCAHSSSEGMIGGPSLSRYLRCLRRRRRGPHVPVSPPRLQRGSS